MFGSYKKSAYLCRRLVALGNLKAAFIALAGTIFALYLLIMEEEYGKLYQI